MALTTHQYSVLMLVRTTEGNHNRLPWNNEMYEKLKKKGLIQEHIAGHFTTTEDGRNQIRQYEARQFRRQEQKQPRDFYDNE